MKKLKLFIAAVLITCMSSCIGYTYAQDDMYYTDEVSYSTIVTFGTPFYVGDVLSYYLYRGVYYYPYFWQDAWYFYPFNHVQPHGYVFRPWDGFRPDRHFRRPDNFVSPGRRGDGIRSGFNGNRGMSGGMNNRGFSGGANNRGGQNNMQGNRSAGNQGSSSRIGFSGGIRSGFSSGNAGGTSRGGFSGGIRSSFSGGASRGGFSGGNAGGMSRGGMSGGRR